MLSIVLLCVGEIWGQIVNAGSDLFCNVLEGVREWVIHVRYCSKWGLIFKQHLKMCVACVRGMVSVSYWLSRMNAA